MFVVVGEALIDLVGQRGGLEGDWLHIRVAARQTSRSVSPGWASL